MSHLCEMDEHADTDDCIACDLRVEVAALRGKLERTVGYWNDTRAERGEYLERAERAERDLAEARELLARGLDRCDCATGACEWHTDTRAFLARGGSPEARDEAPRCDTCDDPFGMGRHTCDEARGAAECDCGHAANPSPLGHRGYCMAARVAPTGDVEPCTHWKGLPCGDCGVK